MWFYVVFQNKFYVADVLLYFSPPNIYSKVFIQEKKKRKRKIVLESKNKNQTT